MYLFIITIKVGEKRESHRKFNKTNNQIRR